MSLFVSKNEVDQACSVWRCSIPNMVHDTKAWAKSRFIQCVLGEAHG
jgi:hypothetical protein